MSVLSRIDSDTKLSTADRTTAVTKTVRTHLYWLSSFFVFFKNATSVKYGYEEIHLLSRRQQKR